jgi:predicted flap endonuclease-1-like 5' DNA nuclease
MSDSNVSAPFAPVFRAQRALIDTTIETQKTIHAQGFELTRESAKAVFGVFLRDGEADGAIDDVVDRLEAADEDLLDEVQQTATEGVSAAEETVDGAEEAADEVRASTQDTLDAATDAADDAVDAAEETIDDAPVVSIDGIGETYSDRLEDAGFGTVGELATASVDEIAEAAQVGTDRAAEWIERAQAETEN